MVLSDRMPEVRALEVLLTVARTGSLNTAAKEIGLTQQAVSHRIASLEAVTGVPLVTRTNHGSSLTPAGSVVVQWADRLLQVAAEIDAGLAALRSDRRLRLRVSASLTVAEQLLPGWLVSWQLAARDRGDVAPEVVLVATNSDHVIEQVRAGRADLGFVEGPGVPRGMRSRIVAHDELVLVVRPDHRWARRGRHVSPEELAGTPLATREVGSGTRDALSAALAAAGRQPVAPALELSTAASVRAAVLAGAAPAVMSRLAVADDLGTRRLVAVTVDGLDLRRALRAVWIGARTPPAGALRDLLAHIRSVGSG